MRVQGRTDVTTMDAKRDLKHKNFLMLTGNTCTLEMFPSTNVQNVKKVVAHVTQKNVNSQLSEMFRFSQIKPTGEKKEEGKDIYGIVYINGADINICV